MYRMAMLAMAINPVPECDMGRVLRMCLVHDLAESRIGDITPDDNIPVSEKHQMEREAMAEITSLLPGWTAWILMSLYLEYEKHESLEAKLTKDLDTFDFVHQAFHYETEHAAKGLDPADLNFERFYQSANSIQNPQLKRMAEKVIADRSILMQQFSQKDSLVRQEDGDSAPKK